MTKKQLFILFFFFLFLGLPTKSNANIIHPDYLTNKCNSDEVEVKCSYINNTPSGLRIYDECSLYKNSPNYRFLVSSGLHSATGYSFSASDKYCYKPVSIAQIIPITINKLFFQLILTLLFELPIFLICGFRSKRNLLIIILANILSVLLFVLSGLIIRLDLSNIIFFEILIIIFESLFISYFINNLFKKVVITVILANVISAFIGSNIIILLSIIIRALKI